LPALAGIHSYRSKRHCRDRFAADLHCHPAIDDHADQTAGLLVIGERGQHHVAIDAQPLDQHRLPGIGKGFP
jgi:hypothetical protein